MIPVIAQPGVFRAYDQGSALNLGGISGGLYDDIVMLLVDNVNRGGQFAQTTIWSRVRTNQTTSDWTTSLQI